MTTSEIDSILDKLKNRLGSGVVSVQFEGTTISYSSPDQIANAIRYFEGIRASAAEAEGQTVTRRSRIVRWRN